MEKFSNLAELSSKNPGIHKKLFRPYKASTSLARACAHSYFIRRFSSTVKAKTEEERDI